MSGEPSAWVRRFASLIVPGGTVLDVACGAGRHARLFLDQSQRVVAVDRDVSGLADLAAHPRLQVVQADLENDGGLPVAGCAFDGVVVTRYLHRPLLPALVAAVAPGGVLLYETFARGHERFGPPTNPDYLLQPGELLEAVRGRLHVVAYEDLVVGGPRRAALQRICAVREAAERR